MSGYLDALELALRGVRPVRPRLHVVWTASRDWPDDLVGVADRIGDLLWTHHGRRVRLAHGAARGGDQLAEEQIARYRWQPGRYPVSRREWATVGGWAGHQRNARMLEAEQPDLVIALIHRRSRGATGCRDNALARGIPTVTVDDELALIPRVRARL